MVHSDIKDLRNFKEDGGIRNSINGNRDKSANEVAGSQYMHVALDDHSHCASVRIVKDETAFPIVNMIDYCCHHGIKPMQ